MDQGPQNSMSFLGIPFEADNIESLHLVKEFGGKKYHIVVGQEDKDDDEEQEMRIHGFNREDLIEIDLVDEDDIGD